MIKIVFLLSFITATSLFAIQTQPDPNTQWFIYTYGDVGSLGDAMRFLSSVGSNGTYSNMIYIAIVVGILLSGFTKKIFDIKAAAIQIGVSILMMFVMFGARTDVHIVNVKNYTSYQIGSNYQAVSGVPFAFAFVASAFSTFGYSMARLVSDGIGLVDGSSYSELSFIKTGAVGGTDIYSRMVQTKLKDLGEEGQTFQAYYGSYFQVCVIEKAMAYSEKTASYIQESTDLLIDIDPENIANALNVDISIDIVDFYAGRKSCKAAYLDVVKAYGYLINSKNINSYYGKLFEKDFGNVQKVLGSVVKVYAQSTGNSAANDIQDFTLAMGMMNQSNVAFANYMNGGKASSAGLYGGFGAGLSNASLVSSGMTKAFYSAQQLPNLMMILNFVMYILLPFVFVISLASGQLKILRNFVVAMLWIQLWPVTFEALSYFVNKDLIGHATSSIISAGALSHASTGNMINMNLITQLNMAVASQSAQAANLMWSVPVISGFLLSGSWTAMMGMASQIGSHASAGANADIQQRKQADLSNAQRVSDATGGMWSPTAGELGRMQMDYGLTASSSQTLAEIDTLGGMEKIFSLGVKKSSFNTASDSSEYGNYYKNGSESALSLAGHTGTNKAVDTDIAAEIRSKVVGDKGNDYYKNQKVNQGFVQEGADLSSSQKLIKEFGGTDNAISQLSDEAFTSRLQKTKDGESYLSRLDDMVESKEATSLADAAHKLAYGKSVSDVSERKSQSKLVGLLGGGAEAMSQMSDSAVINKLQDVKDGNAYLNRAKEMVENGEAGTLGEATSMLASGKATMNVAERKAQTENANNYSIDTIANSKEASMKKQILDGSANKKLFKDVNDENYVSAQLTKDKMTIGDMNGFQNMADKYFRGKPEDAQNYLSKYKYMAEHGKTEQMQKLADEKFNGNVNKMNQAMTGANVSYVNEQGNVITLGMTSDGKIGKYSLDGKIVADYTTQTVNAQDQLLQNQYKESHKTAEELLFEKQGVDTITNIIPGKAGNILSAFSTYMGESIASDIQEISEGNIEALYLPSFLRSKEQ